MPLGDFDAVVGKRDLSPQERSTLEEARTVLQKRYKVRRLLRVIAELTGAGIRWPGGTWKVRGYTLEGATIWHVASSASGTVGRSYARQESAEGCTSGVSDGVGVSRGNRGVRRSSDY